MSVLSALVRLTKETPKRLMKLTKKATKEENRLKIKQLDHIPDTHKHKSRIPCPIFGESRFPGNSQIPDPDNIFIVFPIPAPYFGQIPNPENTLPDPL